MVLVDINEGLCYKEIVYSFLFLKAHSKKVAQISGGEERKCEVMDVFEKVIWAISLSYYRFPLVMSCFKV